ACVFRQCIDREEAVRDDLMVGLRISVLSEVTHDEQRNVIPPRYALVEVDAEELRRSAKPDIAFLGEFARQRLKKRLTSLHAAAGEMPSLDIGMLDQKNAAGPINDDGAGSERRGPREAPVEVQKAPDDRFKRATQALQAHRNNILMFQRDDDLSKAVRISPNICSHFRILLI